MIIFLLDTDILLCAQYRGEMHRFAHWTYWKGSMRIELASF